MSQTMTVLLAAAGAQLLLMLVGTALMLRWLRKVAPGQALVVVSNKGVRRVVFAGNVIVFPKIMQAYPFDLTQREFVIERRGRDGIVCKDGTRFSVKLVVRIEPLRTQEEVLAAFDEFGVARLADPGLAESLFRAPAEEALRSVLGKFQHDEVPARMSAIRDEVENMLGSRSGFGVAACVLEDIRPVPRGQLDPNDPNDAKTLARLAERGAF